MKKLLAVSCLLWCALALAAPRVPKAAVKAVPDKASVQSVKTPPSPNGRKGGEPHQAQVKELHQVGRQTKKGQPVAREREALDDIQKAEGKRPEFHPYNK